MIKFIRQILSSQKGQIQPIVLALLAIGMLTISANLNYAATSLNNSRILKEGMKGVYAAEAGVEDVLWSLVNGVPPAANLPENVNQMTVNMQMEDRGAKTLYQGEYIEAEHHIDRIDVDGDIVWDEPAGAYKYTITVTLQHTETIHLDEVGARIPVGYTYQAGSAAIFAGNMSTDEPGETVEADKIRLTGDAKQLVEVLLPNQHPMLGTIDGF